MAPPTALNTKTDYMAETTVTATVSGDAIETDGNERHSFFAEWTGTLAGTLYVDLSWDNTNWEDSGATFNVNPTTGGGTCFAVARGLIAPFIRVRLGGSVSGSGDLNVDHHQTNER